MELLKVDTIDAARDKLIKAMTEKQPELIKLKLLSARGYIAARDHYSNEQVPDFRRSSVDGYAVVSNDTMGANESLPVFVQIVDEVIMGNPAKKEIHTGECVYVPTGGMIPKGANAMVMVEYCELFGSEQIAIYNAVPFGGNIVLEGEDIKKGDLVIKQGTKLYSKEIGVMACLGITEVEVYKPYKITIISTGDELISLDDKPSLGKVRDINSYSISAMAQNQGFDVLQTMVINDDEQALKKAVSDAMQASDIVVISGGSSQGKKDATKKIIDELTGEGAFTHGLALKPGKPTILGYEKKEKVLLVGLPGHPTAAILVFELLIIWLWKYITHQPKEKSVFAKITTNLAGAPGKMSCQLVKLIKNEMEYLAEPIYGKSGLITSLSSSDGYIIIEQNKEGIKKDEVVEVFYL